MTISLNVVKRSQGEKPEGRIPAIVYGPKQKPVAVAVERLRFDKVLREAGESTILELEGIDGEPVEVLIHEVSFNPARGGVQHVDFYAIERGKELTTNVALHYVGTAPVEKTGASVNKVLHEVEVTCRPSKLPPYIEVDVSVLADDEAQIRVSDLALSEGVKIENDSEDVVATVAAVRKEEDETSEAVDMDAVKVEGKGKTEEA